MYDNNQDWDEVWTTVVAKLVQDGEVAVAELAAPGSPRFEKLVLTLDEMTERNWVEEGDRDVTTYVPGPLAKLHLDMPEQAD